MKEIIGYVYKELNGNFVNTVCSEPNFRIELDENDRVVVVSYKTKECYKILGKPLTEIKRKRLARNWALNKHMVYVDITTWESIRRKYGVESKVEIKNDLKTLADNTRMLVDKLERLADLIEEKTAGDSVYNTCIEVKYTFEEMAEELEKLSE